jgi:hypothetical protein
MLVFGCRAAAALEMYRPEIDDRLWVPLDLLAPLLSVTLVLGCRAAAAFEM